MRPEAIRWLWTLVQGDATLTDNLTLRGQVPFVLPREDFSNHAHQDGVDLGWQV
jgi:hypothetical protein